MRLDTVTPFNSVSQPLCFHHCVPTGSLRMFCSPWPRAPVRVRVHCCTWCSCCSCMCWGIMPTRPAPPSCWTCARWAAHLPSLASPPTVLRCFFPLLFEQKIHLCSNPESRILPLPVTRHVRSVCGTFCTHYCVLIPACAPCLHIQCPLRYGAL